MRQNQFTPIIILALNSGSKVSDIEALKSKGLDVFIHCIGSYKGVTEDSYIIPMSEHRRALELAREFKQESVLLRYADGEVFLYYLEDGDLSILGRLEPVSGSEARESKGFTYRPDIDTYYVAKGGR
jgi:hypothetical protein